MRISPAEGSGGIVGRSPVEEGFHVAGEVADLVADVQDTDHIIIGLEGGGVPGGAAFEEFRRAVYSKARWMSLADVIGKEGADVRIAPPGRPEDFRFPVPRRPASPDHRGLVVLCPGADVPDHDDPFSEKCFFLAEEMLRILGFLPSGRILATGLYYPPLDENPLLKKQAFNLGSRLVTGSAAIPDEKA